MKILDSKPDIFREEISFQVSKFVCAYVCVCVCVCVRERKRVCVCVWVSERCRACRDSVFRFRLSVDCIGFRVSVFRVLGCRN